MIRLLLVATLAVSASADPYSIPSPFNYGAGYFRSYPQPGPLIVERPPFIEQVFIYIILIIITIILLLKVDIGN